ncbi:MAG: ABC transporter ATP-binding protein [Ignavibacteria bacterium]|nr:ABC transporter ATP-binding protein [Ignavibacteria bacterium]
MDDFVIIARDLTRKFGDFVAVDSISFNVERGEIFGFLGANGAGKTTAMRMMCGLLMPTSGEIHVAGYNVKNETDAVKKSIGYMSQRFSLYNDLSVQENIDFYGGIYGLSKSTLKQRSQQLLDELDLHQDRSRLVSDLPLGIKQRLAFSTALIHDPSIVFLDEPTSGVDPLTRRQFWEMIQSAAERGITVLITTHYLDEAEYCQRISIMVDGRLAAYDTPENVRSTYSARTMDEVFLKITRKSS